MLKKHKVTYAPSSQINLEICLYPMSIVTVSVDWVCSGCTSTWCIYYISWLCNI